MKKDPNKNNQAQQNQTAISKKQVPQMCHTFAFIWGKYPNPLLKT